MDFQWEINKVDFHFIGLLRPLHTFLQVVIFWYAGSEASDPNDLFGLSGEECARQFSSALFWQ